MSKELMGFIGLNIEDNAYELYQKFNPEYWIVELHDLYIRLGGDLDAAMKQFDPNKLSVLLDTPDYALGVARQFYTGKRVPRLEQAIAKDPEASFYYAVNHIGERFIAGEPAILQGSPDKIIEYARKIVKDRWPEAEAVILSEHKSSIISYWSSCGYRRWPEAEEVLLDYSLARSAFYCEEFIKDRWPELESRMLSDDSYDSVNAICHYCEHVLPLAYNENEPVRWPEAEQIILKHPIGTYEYIIGVLSKSFDKPEGYYEVVDPIFYQYQKKPPRELFIWPEGERIIATDPEASYYYAANYLQNRFIAGEQVILNSRWKGPYEELDRTY